MDENEDSISEDQSSSENQSLISENVASTSTEDQNMESEKQDNVSKVDEIKARISAEIEKVENDIIEIQKVKQESIEKIELKKKELRELSGAIEICEEKDETMREIKEREKEIQERKISLTALDETIANLDKQIGEIQAQHDKATSDLVMKRRKLNEQLRYYDSLNQRLRELLELIQSETKRHEDKLKELAQIRSEVLKRTDLTEEEMKKLIKELDDQIEASNKEHNYLIDCYNKKLSGIQISEPSTVQDIKGEDLDAQILTDEQIQQIEQYETALYQKKHRMSNEERLKLLRSGFQVTPSGRIIAQDKIISLRDARLQGLLAEDEEYGEEEMEITPTEILKEIMPKEVCYSSTTSVSSSERSSSVESELDLHDINYLKRVFGKSLSLALAEITAVQPADPIHYLAHWFIKYRYNQEIDDVKRLELQALMIERDRLEAERWHKELEEEANLAVLEALFRAENIIMQQDFLKMEMLEMEGESIGDLLTSNALNA